MGACGSLRLVVSPCNALLRHSAWRTVVLLESRTHSIVPACQRRHLLCVASTSGGSGSGGDSGGGSGGSGSIGGVAAKQQPPVAVPSLLSLAEGEDASSISSLSTVSGETDLPLLPRQLGSEAGEASATGAFQRLPMVSPAKELLDSALRRASRVPYNKKLKNEAQKNKNRSVGGTEAE